MKITKKSGHRFLLPLAALLSAALLCGCGSEALTESLPSSNKGYDFFDSTVVADEALDVGFYNYATKNDYYVDSEASYDASESFSGSMAPTSSKPTASSDTDISDTERKVIRNAYLSLETKTFDESIAAIASAAEQFGGYVESSYVSGHSINSSGVERYADYTIRVPADQLDAYLNSLGESFNVLSKRISSDDITNTYYDIQARLNSLEIQEERLLKMLETSDELEYLIQLESALADVRYQIENYYSQIRRYDSQVSYSTVTLNISEVIEYQKVIENPKTFGQRFSTAAENSWKNFVDGLEDFAIDFIYALPALLIWIIIIAVVVIVIKLCISRHKKKKAERYQAQLQLYNAANMQNNSQDTEKK